MNHVLKHLPKYVTAVCILIMLAFVASVNTGCNVTKENVAPEQRAEFEQHEQAQQMSDALLVAAKQQLDSAEASNDAAAVTAARANVALAEKAVAEASKRFADFEARVLHERAGPIVAMASSIHPALAWTLPALQAFVPLLGSRGRKHAAIVLDSLNPLSPTGGTSQEKGINLSRALASLWAYFGPGHSSPESAEAFAEAQATAGAKA